MPRRPHIKIENIPPKRKIESEAGKMVKIPKTEIKPENQPGPGNWREMFENIRKMRISEDAPVDSMGCHKCYCNNATITEKRFQILISLLMSSQGEAKNGSRQNIYTIVTPAHIKGRATNFGGGLGLQKMNIFVKFWCF